MRRAVINILMLAGIIAGLCCSPPDSAPAQTVSDSTTLTLTNKTWYNGDSVFINGEGFAPIVDHSQIKHKSRWWSCSVCGARTVRGMRRCFKHAYKHNPKTRKKKHL